MVATNDTELTNNILSLPWSWIVVGKLIFCVSLKLLPKPWGWVLITIIAVMVQLYFINLTFFDYAFMYIFLILAYVLFHLVLFPLWYYLVIVLSSMIDLVTVLAMNFFMEVLKIGLHC